MIDHLIPHAKILIVDDEVANVRLLEKILDREGYHHVSMTTDSRRAVPMFADDPPDLVLLDLHMPHVTGYECLKAFAKMADPADFVPIIVLTADVTPGARRLALADGAHDLVGKPFDTFEVALRIKNILRTRFLHRVIANDKNILDERVRERTRLLQKTISGSAQKEILAQERQRAFSVMASAVKRDFGKLFSELAHHTDLILLEKEADKTSDHLKSIASLTKEGQRMLNQIALLERATETNPEQSISLAQLVEEATASPQLYVTDIAARPSAVPTELVVS